MRAKSIFVGGTSSHSGKSWMSTAICAWLRRGGLRVAPFKAQNMSNNSYPCAGGGEIGRAQVAQARACGLEPEPAMNPILLKPASATGSQVIVNGKLWKTLSAREYYEHFDQLLPVVLHAFEDLASRFDFIVIEGAGSVAELNLRNFDLVNFGLAARLQSPALLVGDIERGGVFASIIGTVSLLEPAERQLLRSFAVNKFRGDLSLFDDGRRILEQRTGLPCLGVFPFEPGIELDAEDSLSVPGAAAASASNSPCAVVRLPHISNATDFRLLPDPAWISAPVDRRFDVIFLPGTKNTIEDLAWLRSQSLDEWIMRQSRAGATIIGICGGFQMLGRTIHDPDHMESETGQAEGLGLLPMETVMASTKEVRLVTATTSAGVVFQAYEIHLGQSHTTAPVIPLFTLDNGAGEGMRQGQVLGTYLHGAFEHPAVLSELAGVDARPALTESASFERLADWFATNSSGFKDLYL